METKTIWYAMDADGYGILSHSKPERDDEHKVWIVDIDAEYICQSSVCYFPSLTWESEPIEIEIKQV